jgi:hypothetical protein
MADNRSSRLLMSFSGPVGATSRVSGGASRCRGLGSFPRSGSRLLGVGVGVGNPAAVALGFGGIAEAGGCRPRAWGWRPMSGPGSGCRLPAQAAGLETRAGPSGLG